MSKLIRESFVIRLCKRARRAVMGAIPALFEKGDTITNGFTLTQRFAFLEA